MHLLFYKTNTNYKNYSCRKTVDKSTPSKLINDETIDLASIIFDRIRVIFIDIINHKLETIGICVFSKRLII